MIGLQYVLPQRLLSRWVGALTRLRAGRLTQFWIQWFIRHYGVDMAEAEKPELSAYASFNAFFTRSLKAGARPMAPSSWVISPVDGVVSELGALREGQLLQAKGHYYSVEALLGGSKIWATQFQIGHYLTAYLSPKDYHRVHMPIGGRLTEVIYVPGRLFSVNAQAVDGIPHLFARNERLIAYFETEMGLMAVIFVGAMLVGQIEVVWQGIVNATHGSEVQQWAYPENTGPVFKRGQELGHFNMGSTVIVLFNSPAFLWEANLKNRSSLRVGQGIGLFEGVDRDGSTGEQT